MISSVLYLFLISTINFQIDSSGLKNENVIDSTNFIIVDTVAFEGIMILDGVNNECYLVKSDGLKKIRLTYKSNEHFIKDFKKTEKMNFLDPFTFKALLLKYQGIELPEDLFWMHHPIQNGNSVYQSDSNTEIYISLLSSLLVKTKISLEALKKSNIPYIETGQEEEFVYFYSFL